MYLNLEVDKTVLLKFVFFSTSKIDSGIKLEGLNFTVYLCNDLSDANCKVSFHYMYDFSSVPHFDTMYNQAGDNYVPVINNGWISDSMRNTLCKDFWKYSAD